MSNKPILKHYGQVSNGMVKFYQVDLYKANLKELEGQEIEVTIKKRHKQRSDDQAGFYRGGICRVCIQYEMFSHMEVEDVHEFFANKFLSYNKHLQVGQETFLLKKTISTTSLSKEEMKEYIDKCIHWCAEHGIEIKDPEQYEAGKYKTVIKEIDILDTPIIRHANKQKP